MPDTRTKETARLVPIPDEIQMALIARIAQKLACEHDEAIARLLQASSDAKLKGCLLRHATVFKGSSDDTESTAQKSRSPAE